MKDAEPFLLHAAQVSAATRRDLAESTSDARACWQGLQGNKQAPTQQGAWQQLNNLAAWHARVSKGRLVPVREADVVPLRAPGADRQRVGFKAADTLISPAGDCVLVKDATGDAHGLHVVHLPASKDARLQLPVSAERDWPQAAAGFSCTGQRVGTVSLQLNEDGEEDAVSKVHNVATAAWSEPRVHAISKEPATAIWPILFFSSDDSLAACALQGAEVPIYVLVFSVEDSSHSELVPVDAFPETCSFVRMLWLPGRHTLLLVTSCGVLAADVGPAAAHGSELDRFMVTLFPKPCVIVSSDLAPTTAPVYDEPSTSAEQLFLVCKAQPVEQPDQADVCSLLIKELLPGSRATGRVHHVQTISAGCEAMVAVRQVCNSYAVWVDFGVTGFCQISAGAQPAVWDAADLRQPVWSPGHLPGRFLAGLVGKRVMVFDAKGRTVGSWYAGRDQAPFANPFRLGWVGAGRRQLAVVCGVGPFPQTAVWPALVVTLLKSSRLCCTLNAIVTEFGLH